MNAGIWRTGGLWGRLSTCGGLSIRLRTVMRRYGHVTSASNRPIANRPQIDNRPHKELHMELNGTKTLVVGMKKSGIASADLLVREGAVVCATDLKSLDQLPEAAVALGRLNVPFRQQAPDVFEGHDLIVLSPDVPADLPPLESARQRGVRVIGEVELAAPFLKGETIGITGSNGKTTTTSLIGHILRESGVTVQVGGNIRSEE